MSPQLVAWVAAMIIQSALLGRQMYTIVCLTDLENDFINPFDLAAKMNAFVPHELVGQAVIAGVLLLSGNWFAGAAHAALFAGLCHLATSGKMRIDTTDAFRQLPAHKRQRIALLISHLLLFVLVVYRLIESALMALLTPEGRAMTKKLLHEAATSVHGY